MISCAEREVSEADAAVCLSMIRRVSAGEPVQYVCGKAQFAGREFVISRDVLIPRPDTEILLDEALKRAAAFAESRVGNSCMPEVLDMCTGSGILAVSIKAELPCASVSASDISSEALKIAALNAGKHGTDIEFYLSDLFSDIPVQKRFDIIVSNPPYVSDNEYDLLDASVKDHEPEIALRGGNDGADFYRRISSDSRERLKAGGWLCFEIGDTQAETVLNIMEKDGFKDLTVTRDIAGRDRVVYGRYM